MFIVTVNVNVGHDANEVVSYVKSLQDAFASSGLKPVQVQKTSSNNPPVERIPGPLETYYLELPSSPSRLRCVDGRTHEEQAENNLRTKMLYTDANIEKIRSGKKVAEVMIVEGEKTATDSADGWEDVTVPTTDADAVLAGDKEDTY